MLNNGVYQEGSCNIYHTCLIVVFKVTGSSNNLTALYFFSTSLRLLLDASSSSKKIIGEEPGMIGAVRTPHSFARLS